MKNLKSFYIMLFLFLPSCSSTINLKELTEFCQKAKQFNLDNPIISVSDKKEKFGKILHDIKMSDELRSFLANYGGSDWYFELQNRAKKRNIDWECPELLTFFPE